MAMVDNFQRDRDLENGEIEIQGARREMRYSLPAIRIREQVPALVQRGANDFFYIKFFLVLKSLLGQKKCEKFYKKFFYCIFT